MGRWRSTMLVWVAAALSAAPGCAKDNPNYGVGADADSSGDSSSGVSETSGQTSAGPGSSDAGTSGDSVTSDGSGTTSVSTTTGTDSSAGTASDSAGDAWLDPGYAARKPIRIHPEDDLVDFTVGIVLDADPDLAAAARPDGRDLAFTTADGVTELPFELEHYDAGTLAAWVFVPQLTGGADTVIYLYYGDPEAASRQDPDNTWPADRYRGVWHMTLDGQAAPDSTAGSHDAAAPNAARTPTDVLGIAGRAADYDGIDDALPVGDPADDSLDFGTDSFSVSVWVRIEQSLGGVDMVVHKGGGNVANRGYGIFLGTDQWRSGLSDGSTHQALVLGDEVDLLGQWNHLVVVVDRQTDRFTGYLNGIQVDDLDISAYGSVSSDFDLEFGRMSGFEFKDTADELRLHDVALTPDEVAAAHRNLARPDQFFTVGAPETP